MNCPCLVVVLNSYCVRIHREVHQLISADSLAHVQKKTAYHAEKESAGFQQIFWATKSTAFFKLKVKIVNVGVPQKSDLTLFLYTVEYKDCWMSGRILDIRESLIPVCGRVFNIGYTNSCLLNLLAYVVNRL